MKQTLRDVLMVLVAFLGYINLSQAQDRTVKGKVTDTSAN